MNIAKLITMNYTNFAVRKSRDNNKKIAKIIQNINVRMIDYTNTIHRLICFL